MSGVEIPFRRMRRSMAMIALLLLVACSGSGSGSGESSSGDPLVNQARTGVVSPFAPRETASASASYAPGGDTSVAVYTSRVTAYDGTYDAEALLSMELIPSAITQTRDLMLISPLMRFSIRDAEGEVIERPELRKSLKVETIVDRFVEEKNAVGLIILDYGTADEQRYMIVPEDMTYELQADNSRLLTFETRDTSFVFAMAAAKDGAPTNGFSRYSSVPDDSTSLSASSTGVEDEGSEAVLTWTPAEGSRTGYILKYAFAAYTTLGCQEGEEIPTAEITSVRQKFPKNYTDSFTVRDLQDDATVYFQLCSINDRTPPDRSPGLNLTFELPKRAHAVLTNTPADPTNVATLNVEVGGDGIIEYRYAVVAGNGSCTAATPSAWTDVDTRITPTLSEGSHLLCVWGKKSELNIQTAATTHAWVLDLTPPSAFTVSSVATPTNDTTPTVSWLASTGAARYTVKIASDNTCATVVQTLNTTAINATPAALSNGTYYVCVRATDAAGNTTDASNDGVISFEVDTVPPAFVSLLGDNEAGDGFVNANEVASTSPFVILSASDYSSEEYTDVLDDTPSITCNASKVYGNVTPPDISSIPASDDSFVVCAKLTDDAGNVTYGKSAVIVRDTVAPTFTSLNLANAVADGYLNDAETVSTAAIATLVGSGFAAASYSDPLDNTSPVTCDDQQTYGNSSVPTIDMTPGSDADYVVCVKLEDAAGNAVFGGSAVFIRDALAPTFTSLDKDNDASDGYLNASEISSTLPFATLVASDYDVEAYSAILDNDPVISCDHTKSYPNVAIPAINTIPAADGDYVVCVKLTDTAGNVTYGMSDNVVRDASPPTFTSLDLAAEAADGFVNATETGSNSAIASLTATGFDTAEYTDILDDSPAVTCNGSQTYGNPSEPTIDSMPASDDVYRVCVKLTDTAGNETFGASDPVVRDTVAPSITDVSSTTPNGAYGETSTITIVVETDEDVTLDGTTGDAEFLLETGATDRKAIFASASGTTLTFTYVVDAGDESTDLDINGAAPHISYSGDRSLADVAGNPLNVDASAATSLASNSAIVIDTTAPSAFNITAPTAAATVGDNTFAIAWSDPGDATTYDVRIDNDSGCGTPVQSYAGVVTTSKDTALLADGTWFVCVTARDAAGNVTPATNDNVTFTVATGTWAPMTATSAPAARFGAAAVWTGSTMILWGGEGSGGAVDDGAVYTPPGAEAWAPTQSVDAPSARSGHTAVWTGASMIVWGGRNGVAFEDTGSLYDPSAAGSWTDVTMSGAPSERAGHTAVWTGSEMIVWGGEDGSSVLGDGGQYTPPGAEAWAPTQSSGAPSARKGHTAIWTGTHMIVWGGNDGTSTVDTGGRYDPTSGGTWTTMSSVNAPSPREGHVAIWTGSVMIVFGGHSGGTYLNDGAMYDPVGDTWTALASSDAPPARADMMAAWDSTGSRMLLFGGFDGAHLASGAAFDPTGNQWAIPALNTAAAPTARRQATAIWTGTELLIWGGTDGTSLATGFRYTPP